MLKRFAPIIQKVRAMLSKINAHLANAVFRRRAAYRRVFLDPKGGLSPDGRVILAHLAKICRATTTKGIVGHSQFGAAVDVNATMIALGKHEVFQVIMKEINIDLDQVFKAVQEEEAILST